ncbi:hypothetical protein ACFVUS_07065 [Nocardia sp. NPDC058058]|uniref:hypothetical protein n=1 Tax=Nocardia sp. NPDC058058 TaxID=3346317 RepID=UPI0036DB677B
MATAVTGLTHEDCDTIGFVISCLFDQSIDTAELRAWCEHVIVSNEMDDIPQYMFELVSFDGDLSELFDILGFTPSFEPSQQEDAALYGIAFQRGVEVYDPPVSGVSALEALRLRPDVLQRFRATFPFIELAD